MVGNLTRVIQVMGAVIVQSGEKYVPLAVTSQKLKKRGSKKMDSLRLSRECCPNPFFPNINDEGGWIVIEKMLQHVPRKKSHRSRKFVGKVP